MRIAHVSDLHIRNHKYRSEYAAAFQDLYRQLELLEPDLVVNTGDTVHSKLAVSPELFDDIANHMLAVTDIAPYWVILGNHDLNLKNVGRTDAVSPIVRALKGRTKHELFLSDDRSCSAVGVNDPLWWERGADSLSKHFWHYDIRGISDPSLFKVRDDVINIGLYHGSISGCVTDIGFVMEEGEAELDKFASMDYVMLGDIHKRQSFRGGRIQYPGSMIQQNYGEEPVKGFLLWDIVGKDEFTVDFHPIAAPGRFFTIQVPKDLDLTGVSVPKGSRIRAIVEGGLSPSRRMKLEEGLVESFAPIEVIAPDVSDDRTQSEPVDIDELVGSREKLMRDHLSSMGLDAVSIDAIVKLFRQYEAALDMDSAGRGTTWQLKRIAWDNMMNYGEGSSIDFTRLSGLIGIFGPNAIGKSSIFDILLQALFDKVSKEVPRNIDLVNDNKDVGSMTVEFEANGHPYSIERSIERIHYGQRKFAETKQWGKTTLDFSSVDDSLNGTSRPETEREIRSIVGNFEDFVLTAMVSQSPIFGLPGGADILNCRETDRRKILFRFLDLDVYERIAVAARDDLKALMGKLRELDGDALRGLIAVQIEHRESAEQKLFESRQDLRRLEDDLDRVMRSLERANANNLHELAIERDRLKANRRQKQSAMELSAGAQSKRLSSFSKLCQARHDHISSRPPEGTIPLDKLHIRMTELRVERERAITELSRTDQRVKQGVRSLATLEGIPCEGKFPTCRFIAEASSFMEQREEIERALHQLVSKRDGTSAELRTLEGYDVIHKDFMEWRRRLSELDLDISRQEQQISAGANELHRFETELSMSSLRIAELDLRLGSSAIDEIEALRGDHIGLSKACRDLQDSIDSRLRLIGGIDSRIEKMRADLKSLDGLADRVSIHEKLLEMCGKDGLPYRILSLVLPVINSEISKILSGIVKFNVFFEADPEEQTVSLFIQYGDYRSRPLSLGSGAEKFIASLAVRVALLSVSSLPKTDILVIDEGFGRLDPEHLEALQRMFEYLREAFGSVFIVSHVDSMRDVVDHSIEITSRDGYAHVEVA